MRILSLALSFFIIGYSSVYIWAAKRASDHDDEFLRKMEELYKDNAARADKNFSRVVDPLRVGVGGNIYREDDNRAVENKNQPNYKP